METFILPVNLPPELDRGIQTAEPVQWAREFPQILEKNYALGQGQSGDENGDPQKGTGEGLELPTQVSMESIPMGFPLPSVLEEPSNSVPGPIESQTAPPFGLGQEENLPGLLLSPPMAALRFKESLSPNSSQNLEEVATYTPSFTPLEKGSEERTSIPILQGGDAFLSRAKAPVQAPQNSPPLADPKEMRGQTVSLPSRAIEETSIPPGKDQRAIHFSAQDPKDHEPMNRLGWRGHVNLDKEGLPIQESRSQNWQAEFFPKADEEPSVSPGTKFSGEEMDAVPMKESKKIFWNLSPSMVEDRRIPDTQGQTLASAPEKESWTHFFAPGGKDLGGILGMAKGDRNLQGKEIQNLFSPGATSHEGVGGPMTLADTGEESHSPNTSQPVKPENQEIYQEVVQKMIWMVRAHEERFRLTLDPPHLGHIYMEIRRNHENITTTLWTDNPAAKLTLETNQGEIQKIIESEGFRLEKFDVFVQQDWGRFPGNHRDSLGPYSWSPLSPLQNKRPLSTAPDGVPAVHLRGLHSRSKYLDFFV